MILIVVKHPVRPAYADEWPTVDPFRTISPNTQDAECNISSEVVMGRILCAFSKLITKCRTMANLYYC
jgi:hypothetical protein